MLRGMSAADTHPKDRLLATASRLFYAEGIHAVGVERLVSEASVTRATFYRHYPTKDDLVAAYLTETSLKIRAAVEAARDGKTPREGLADTMAVVGDATRGEDFRGCQFLNAAAEYPDPAHPVHQAVLAHRQWFLSTVTELLAETGETAPEPAARHFVMLRDGAMAAGCLSDPAPVCETFLLGIEGILRYRDAPVAAEAGRRT